MTNNSTILVISDSEQKNHDLKVMFDFIGEPVTMVSSLKAEKELESHSSFIAVVIGYIENQQQEKKLLQQLATIKTGLSMFKLGSKDDNIPSYSFIEMIPEPLKSNDLIGIIQQCQTRKASKEKQSQDTISSVLLFRSLVGNSPTIQTVRQMIEQVSTTDASVLILGESGTGKEVVARNLHYMSNRKDKPFVPINCGAIPAELLESELFGHEKGAFTGAVSARKGRFEMANGGTLFLDEIGDMPLSMQVKLLRVLQEQNFERVGGSSNITTDVRVIAATHRNLENEIKQGNFREDLYYRLNVFPIEVPSLRERVEDIPLLVDELLARMKNENQPVFKHMTGEALAALQQYNWPGNIRELANLVERLTILYPDTIIDLDNLPAKFTSGSDNASGSFGAATQTKPMPTLAELPQQSIDLKTYLSDLELGLIKQALKQANGVVARAAKHLNIRRTTLVEKMRKYGISRDDAMDV